MSQRNLVNLFQASAAEHADQPAMRYKREGGWHTVTYAGMKRFVEDLAGGLLSLDLEEQRQISDDRLEGWIRRAQAHQDETPKTRSVPGEHDTAPGRPDPFGDVDPITDVEGIGETYGEKLTELGIETTQDLWHADTQRIADALDVAPKRVENWQQRAELMAISGLGPQYAELLERVGIETITDLATADAADLTARLKEKADQLIPDIQGNPITQPRVERWITLAQDHDPGTSPPSTPATEPTATQGRPDPFGDVDPITDVEGIGQVYGDKLVDLGIETTQDLWHADTQRIATGLDVAPKRVETWQRMAELMAVSGIGPQYAELLVRSGVGTIDALAAADPYELGTRVREKQDDVIPSIQGNPIGDDRVRRWITLAQDHAPGAGDARPTSSPAGGRRGPFGDVDPITDVEGIGETYGEKLTELGIETTQDLWHADTQRIADALDIAPKRVENWQQRAELMAISGLGPQYAELLERVGIETITDLATADAADLTDRLEAKADELIPDIQGNPITQPRVERWITLAQDHDPATGDDAAPVRDLEGIGPRYADALERAGVETVADLADADLEDLARRLEAADGDRAPAIEGSRVGIWSANSPEWVLADYATLHCNAVTVPVYETLIPDQATYILDDCDARVVFVEDAGKLEALLARLDELPSLEYLVVMGPIPAGYEDKAKVLGMDEVYARGRRYLEANEDVLADQVAGIEPDDLASFVYTSGTTGNPKGVMLTHRNFASNVEATVDVLPMDGEIHLAFLPLAHSFARTGDAFVPYSTGSTVCFAEGVDELTENMEEVRPTIMLSVPRLYEKMHASIQETIEASGGLKASLFEWALDVGAQVAHHEANDEDVPVGLKAQHALARRLVLDKLKDVTGGRLKFFVSGGAALSPDIMEFFGAAGLWIMQGYGLTETSPVLSVNTPEAYRFGSVGRPIPGVDVRIDETVWDGPEGEGEIQVQGPNVTQGYHGLPDQTDALFTEDGWLRTGDVGRIDEDGFLYITDRLKKIFKTAYGKYIVPNKIETKLTDRPFIAQAVVIGEDRKYVGALIAPEFQRLAAWADEQGIPYEAPADLVEHEAVHEMVFEQVEAANEALARYESIKRIELLPRELDQDHDELTPTLKIKRRVVEDAWSEKIDALYPDE